MAVTHAPATRTALAQEIRRVLDGTSATPGRLKVYAGATKLADFPLAVPSGVAAGGVLTFSPTAATIVLADGTPDRFELSTSSGALVLSGSAGAEDSGADLELEIPEGGWKTGGILGSVRGTYTPSV